LCCCLSAQRQTSWTICAPKEQQLQQWIRAWTSTDKRKGDCVSKEVGALELLESRRSCARNLIAYGKSCIGVKCDVRIREGEEWKTAFNTT